MLITSVNKQLMHYAHYVILAGLSKVPSIRKHTKYTVKALLYTTTTHAVIPANTF